MRGHRITPDEHAAIKLALGHAPDSDKMLKVARDFKRGVSTVCKIYQAGCKWGGGR